MVDYAMHRRVRYCTRSMTQMMIDDTQIMFECNAVLHLLWCQHYKGHQKVLP